MESGADLASNTNQAHGKTRRLACVRCRQSKIRCDNDQTGLACRRCAASGYVCDYNAEYKRVSKKRKIQELVNEVQHLRAFVGNSAPSPSHLASQSPDPSRVDSVQPRYASQSRTPRDAADAFASPSVVASASSARPLWRQETEPAQTDRMLENVAVSGTQSSRLFAKFIGKLHPFIPLLEEIDSPDSTYAQSPLLYWAIIAVSSCHDGLDSMLHMTLAPAVTDLLWKTFAHPPYSVADIQGMLLLCLWPFPVPAMSRVSRFPLVAATRSAAMQIGLHCLDDIRDFSHLKQTMTDKERLKAAKTWAACVVAVESITGFVGQPSVVRDEVTSDRMLEHPIPPQLNHLFQIFMFSNRVHRLMTSVGRETGDLVRGERTVILTILERDLKNLWTSLAEQISGKALVVLMFVGLQLRVYYFFERQSPRRQQGIVRAYQLALMLAEQLKEVDGSIGLLRHAPVVYRDAMILTSIFILKVTKSSYAEIVDVVAGDAALDICLAKLQECVSTTGDFRGKVCQMITQLRTVDHASRDPLEKEPHLKLRTRLSGSLVHDFLWMWREEFGGQKSRKASPRRRNETVNELREACGVVNHAAQTAHRTDRQPEDNFRRHQPQIDDRSQVAAAFDYQIPQYAGLHGCEDTERSGDLLFAELFSGGGLGPSSSSMPRADIDWFYQADALTL